MERLDLSVTLKKTVLRSPIVLLSGTVSPLILKLNKPEAVGLVILKTVTLNSKVPNIEPRMWDLGSGVLNSIGLYNPGIEAFFKEEINEYLELDYDYGVSVSGFSEEEFIEVIEKASAFTEGLKNFKVLELNFSCPNVKKGGYQFASEPSLIKKITAHASKTFDGEVWVKISPAFDVFRQAKAAVEGGATALVVANTMPATCFNENLKPVLGNITGGLSGKPLFFVNLRNVFELRTLNIPIVASGGIDSLHGFLSYLKAGSICGGLGTVLFREPDFPTKLFEALKEELVNKGSAKFTDYLKSLREGE